MRAALGLALGSLMGGFALADVPPQVTDAIQKAEASVKAIVEGPADQRNFDNTVGALDDLATRLDNGTSLPIFMQYVSTDAKQRDDARDAEEAVSNFLIDLGKREDLYNVIKAYADTKPTLQGEQKRLLEFTMRDYRRSGMALPEAQRNRLKQIETDIQKLSTDFQTNIYEDETVLVMSPSELKGVPADVVKRLKPSINGMVIVTMDGPTFNAIMDYASIEATRQKAWTEYKRRGGQKNVALLEKILKLRAEGAKLLGYANTVDYEIETRMAKNAKTVAKFYADLKPVVRKKAQLDHDQFLAAKRALTKNPKAKLYPWDQSFYKNLLMKQKYAVDSQKVAEYFSLKAVYDGLFQITSALYGIKFTDVTKNAASLGLPVWHPDVQLWAVTDKANGELLGHIYTDLHPRDNKYNHAACWGLQARKVWPDGTVQKPLAALVTNFTKPTADKPSLMTHDEVETFFHEFGHALHNILTNTHYARFSGTSVARDFVEAPSQMFENWVWEPSVLKLFAKHYKTGQPLPDKMLSGMKSARTLGSGLETEHQMYYGMVDQAYHLAPNGNIDTTKVGIDMLGQVEMYQPPVGTFFQASFGHLMGYQGAYYGYLWSLVYAQDMFQRFEQKGILSPEAGKYYRDKILSRGGTMDEMDMLRDYLGREPSTAAFLKHLGLSK
jgi:thimet oligopeptidase